MSAHYQVTMDNNTLHEIYAGSAGEAMFIACHRSRGHLVRACQVGKPADKEVKLLAGEGPGRIMFDVPKHNAIPLDPAPGRQKMCAVYVRAGDVLEQDVFEWHVRSIKPLNSMFEFELESVKDSNDGATLRFHRNQMVTVTR